MCNMRIWHEADEMRDEPNKTERVPVMMSLNELSEIDDVRFERRLHSRSETIRFLVKKGIETISSRSANNADMLVAGSES